MGEKGDLFFCVNLKIIYVDAAYDLKMLLFSIHVGKMFLLPDEVERLFNFSFIGVCSVYFARVYEVSELE